MEGFELGRATYQHNPLLIGDLWDFLLPPAEMAQIASLSAHAVENLTPGDWPPGPVEAVLKVLAAWPPDVFALAASILRRSGAYTRLREVPFSSDLDTEDLQNWRNHSAPDQVVARLQVVWRCRRLPISQCSSNAGLLTALHRLLADSDEVCRRGPIGGSTSTAHDLSFQFQFETQLQPKTFGSTLCRLIHPSRARVLPKTHTARAGLTLRSFSHHLCYVEPDEIKPLWYTIPGGRNYELEQLKILVVPRPSEIVNLQFTETTGLRLDRLGMGEHRFFRYEPEFTCGRLASDVLDLCDAAQAKAGPIDVVVLPELAVSSADYRLLRQVLLSRQIMLVAGIGGQTQEGQEENRIGWDIPLSGSHAVHLRQRKHHRWNIDRSQIIQYQLGSQFAPARTYWEDIQLGDRHLCFVALRPWLLTSVLICEDLARHEPVGELVRGVGPNLVIALLMDGPQTEYRWSSRYASVLADDPGSSVLSVTSRGMSKRSKPKAGYDDQSKVIGLWKDTKQTTQLKIEEDSDALLLCLNIEPEEEWTADLRKDSASHFPVLSDVIPISRAAQRSHSSEIEAQARKPITFLSPYEASVLARVGALTSYPGEAELTNVHQILRQVYPGAIGELNDEGRKIVEKLLPWSGVPGPRPEITGREEEFQRAIFTKLGLNWESSPLQDPAIRETAEAIARWCRGNVGHWQAAHGVSDTSRLLSRPDQLRKKGAVTGA